MFLNLICSIPDAIGWILVGVVATVLAFVSYKLAKIFAEMWRDHFEEEDDEDEF